VFSIYTRLLVEVRHLSINEQVLLSPRIAGRTEFELVHETTLQGSTLLVGSGRHTHLSVLNLASAKHPGGGSLGGAKAQVESLARRSGLYHSLLGWPSYYSFHGQLKACLYSDWMTFSPHCAVSRTDHGTGWWRLSWSCITSWLLMLVLSRPMSLTTFQKRANVSRVDQPTCRAGRLP
jgi:uncharacterized protein (TIGR02452 family)